MSETPTCQPWCERHDGADCTASSVIYDAVHDVLPPGLELDVHYVQLSARYMPDAEDASVLLHLYKMVDKTDEGATLNKVASLITDVDDLKKMYVDIGEFINRIDV